MMMDDHIWEKPMRGLLEMTGQASCPCLPRSRTLCWNRLVPSPSLKQGTCILIPGIPYLFRSCLSDHHAHNGEHCLLGTSVLPVYLQHIPLASLPCPSPPLFFSPPPLPLPSIFCSSFFSFTLPFLFFLLYLCQGLRYFKSCVCCRCYPL